LISRKVYEKFKIKTSSMFQNACIVLTPKEKDNVEVADFGLNDLERTGLQLVVYINTERVCAKELALTARQTCPEHKHPAIKEKMGKEETFRCRWGEVYIYVPGVPTPNPQGKPPKGDEKYYSVFHEVILKPGEQYTLAPETLHWFQAGPMGAIVSEFSTNSTDENDIFTDPRISRIPEMVQ
jgi:D-lyxose ketol-isomerase